MATADCLSTPTGRLFVKDRAQKTQFLIDTGSDLCVFLRSLLRDRRAGTDYNLRAANASRISTYGYIHLNLDFGLRRVFNWRFVVAEVTKPIIGVDCLNYYYLIVDCRNKRLLDSNTSVSSVAKVVTRSSIDSVKDLLVTLGIIKFSKNISRLPIQQEHTATSLTTQLITYAPLQALEFLVHHVGQLPTN